MIKRAWCSNSEGATLFERVHQVKFAIMISATLFPTADGNLEGLKDRRDQHEIKRGPKHKNGDGALGRDGFDL